MKLVFLVWIEPLLCLFGGLIGIISPIFFLRSAFYSSKYEALEILKHPLGQILVIYSALMTITFGLSLHLISKLENTRKIFYRWVVIMDCFYFYLLFPPLEFGPSFWFGTTIALFAFISRVSLL